MSKTQKYFKAVIIIMILAIFIRALYIVKINISEYQCDVGIGRLNSQEDYDNLYINFDKGQNEGRHINYIMYIYMYNSLPNQIIGQFYHPPLHHFIMAQWLKFMDFFPLNSTLKFESLQLIVLIYSIIILFVFFYILKELELENKIIPMLLFAFYPSYIFLSGSINNDELVFLFSITSLLYLIKWSKQPTMKNAIIIALCIGFGIMTKSSMFVMIIPSVYIYFKVLNEYTNKNKSVKNLLLQLVVFILITSILGFWFHFTRMLQGLETIGIIQPYESLKITNKSLWERFGITNIFKINDYNIWNYLMYSSLSFLLIKGNNIFLKILVINVVLLIIDSIYYIIRFGLKYKLLLITFISWMVSYIFFNIQMPYICSMHSRYVLVPISILIIFLGLGSQKEINKYIKYQIYISSIIISIASIIACVCFI